MFPSLYPRPSASYDATLDRHFHAGRRGSREFACALIYNPAMSISLRHFGACSLALLLSICMNAQTASVTQGSSPPRDGNGIYEVPSSELKTAGVAPKVEFPRELAAYEITDTVVVAVTISNQGRVRKTKVVSGKIDALKEAAEKAVKKWAFQPYLVNGTPVPVRTELTFNFTNTLDRYRAPNGDVPVHLDEKASNALLTKKVEPEYPYEAKLKRIEGAVKLRAIVGEDGHVHGLHIISGPPLLAQEAYNAVRQWVFKPYVEKGRTLPMDTNVTIFFKMR